MSTCLCGQNDPMLLKPLGPSQPFLQQLCPVSLCSMWLCCVRVWLQGHTVCCLTCCSSSLASFHFSDGMAGRVECISLMLRSCADSARAHMCTTRASNKHTGVYIKLLCIFACSLLLQREF